MQRLLHSCFPLILSTLQETLSTRLLKLCILNTFRYWIEWCPHESCQRECQHRDTFCKAYPKLLLVSVLNAKNVHHFSNPAFRKFLDWFKLTHLIVSGFVFLQTSLLLCGNWHVTRPTTESPSVLWRDTLTLWVMLSSPLMASLPCLAPGMVPSASGTLLRKWCVCVCAAEMCDIEHYM